jgi:hypothetical protein
MKYHLFGRPTNLIFSTYQTDQWVYYTSFSTFEEVSKLIESLKDSMEFRAIKGSELSVIEDTETVTYTKKVLKKRTLIDV